MQPTADQLLDAQYEITEAVKCGRWSVYVPPLDVSLIPSISDAETRAGNLYFEKRVFTDEELTLDKLRLTPERKAALNDFSGGRAGQVLAGTFVNAGNRSDGDFTHAFSAPEWQAFMRGYNFLSAIPKGEFLQRLDVDLAREVNRRMFTADPGAPAAVRRFAGMVARGFRWDKGGELRQGAQYARPATYTAAEIENLKEEGVTVIPVGNSEGDKVSAILLYPPPEQVRARLTQLIAALKERVAVPGADVIGAAADFQRSFVALHPFGDCNGRTSRMLMNRVLADFDLPPALFDRDQDRDVSSSRQMWRREVAEAVARGGLLLDEPRPAHDEWLSTHAGFAPTAPRSTKPILVGDQLFQLGQDGMIYDLSARPYLAFGWELVPLAQLEQLIICRRLEQMGKTAGETTLTALTARTRALFACVSADPKAAAQVTVRSDDEVRAADAAYVLAPGRKVAEALTALADLDKIDRARRFTVRGGMGTAVSAMLSDYTQVDLELWYLEQGLVRCKHEDLAERVHDERTKLFDMAKQALRSSVDSQRASEANPLGLRYRYEQMMLDASPLRFASLAEAMGKDGDEHITVWRSDAGLARWLGMAPGSNVLPIMADDAKSEAAEGAERGQIADIYQDLMRLDVNASSEPYLCATSDLSVLAQGTGEQVNTTPLNLRALPAFVADCMVRWVERGPKRAGAPATGGVAAKQREIKDVLGVPGTLWSVRLAQNDRRRLEVDRPGKVFEVRLAKADALPGVMALGGVGEPKQEIDVLARVYPWQIKSVHERAAVAVELPRMTEPSVARSK